MSKLRELRWPGNLRQLENVIRRSVIIGKRAGPIDDKDIDRAIKFDPASHLAGSDIVTRLRALFREGAVENTPFTRDMVDKVLVEVFESEVGRSRAMELLKIGRQAYDTPKDRPRRRTRHSAESGNV